MRGWPCDHVTADSCGVLCAPSSGHSGQPRRWFGTEEGAGSGEPCLQSAHHHSSEHLLGIESPLVQGFYAQKRGVEHPHPQGRMQVPTKWAGWVLR